MIQQRFSSIFFLLEALVSSSGMGRDVHPLTLSIQLSCQAFVGGREIARGSGDNATDQSCPVQPTWLVWSAAAATSGQFIPARLLLSF